MAALKESKQVEAWQIHDQKDVVRLQTWNDQDADQNHEHDLKPFEVPHNLIYPEYLGKQLLLLSQGGLLDFRMFKILGPLKLDLTYFVLQLFFDEVFNV